MARTPPSSTTPMYASPSPAMTNAPPGVSRTCWASATETRAQMNYAGSRMAAWLGRHHGLASGSAAPAAHRRARSMQLPRADALVLTGGRPPIRAKKVRYFAEPLFKARCGRPSHPLDIRQRAFRRPGLASSRPRPRSRSAPTRRCRGATSGPGHTHAQGQSEQSLQQAFNFSTPVAGEAVQTNTDASSTLRPADDLGAAFTGPGLAGTVFALNPDHFDTEV